MDNRFSKDVYLSRLRAAKASLVVPSVTHDILNRLNPILASAALVEDTIDDPNDPLSAQDIKAIMVIMQQNSRDIFNIVEALQQYYEQSTRK